MSKRDSGYYIDTIKETTTQIDEKGNEQTTTVTKTKKRERSNEPDYIKIYTDMWCQFNEIPDRARPLFLELAVRMSYASKNDEYGGQLVATGGPIQEAICKKLDIKRAAYQRYLKELRDCNAIRLVSRGYYQINPSYAGKGEWKYNPRLDRGGVEELIATFKLNADGTKSVKTDIIWADNGEDTPLNTFYREGMGVSAEDQTVLETMSIDITCDDTPNDTQDLGGAAPKPPAPAGA